MTYEDFVNCRGRKASNSHYGTNGTNGTDGGWSPVASDTLKGGHQTSQTSQNENCWLVGVRGVSECGSLISAQAPRQRTAGQAQAWQGREGLDCSSIVPRLFLDCSSIVPRLFLDCCLPQPPLARSFPAMLLDLPCVGVSPITHPYTDGSGVRGGNGGSLPALGIIPADACIRSAAAPCWLCGICMAHRRMRLLLRNEHTT